MDGHVECGFGQIPKNQRGKYAQLPFVETFKQKRKKNANQRNNLALFGTFCHDLE